MPAPLPAQTGDLRSPGDEYGDATGRSARVRATPLVGLTPKYRIASAGGLESVRFNRPMTARKHRRLTAPAADLEVGTFDAHAEITAVGAPGAVTVS